MSMKIFLCLVALPLLASCRPTHCDRYQGDSQFRCGKDNYKADSVLIINISEAVVDFKVEKWIGRDENPTKIKFSDQSYTLQPSESLDIPFSEVMKGTYNEIFVTTCHKDGQKVDCLYAVTVHPKVNK